MVLKKKKKKTCIFNFNHILETIQNRNMDVLNLVLLNEGHEHTHYRDDATMCHTAQRMTAVLGHGRMSNVHFTVACAQ